SAIQVCGRNRGSIRQRCLGAENFALTIDRWCAVQEKGDRGTVDWRSVPLRQIRNALGFI
ncbi:hypothetical protein, partial [Burkholderia sp. Bp8992]|uniref:hypothetical protein n=1 Tax=Burkholderia sp. Bp8992 TaxID=2184554 RepID=UPI001C88EC07